jgi:serine/threonine-protein kinase
LTPGEDSLREALASRYRIDRELGAGGMATVYLAQDLHHERPVALKVLRPELAATLGTERFLREIRLAARLQHPHILAVHDSGDDAGQLWFTMPYVEGESLRDRLTREKQLPVDDALRITREAALALEYAHQHGVVHRDIKPENILLTRDGSTLVADFGIARSLGAADAPQARLTETGLALGTPAYMSPEQAAGDATLDARTDVFSLAAVLYEMLAGQPPFTGATAQAVIAQRFRGDVPSIRRARPAVSEQVDQAVHRAMAVLPADRHASVAEFAHALAQPTAAARARPRIPLALATLALGLVLGLGVLFAWKSREAPPPGSDVGPMRIAVLPFQNLGDTANAYFADGMTDAIRGKLTDLPGLRVIARSSSVQFARSTASPKDIGAALGVQYLLTGTVRWERRGTTSQVQVSPELVNVRDATTKWQQPFSAPLSDVFQVQSDIAGRVAQALDVALGDSSRQQLAARPTQNVAAYDAYLRAEEVANGLAAADPRALQRAIAFYEQATALDSGFALAWARLSRARSKLYFNGTPTPALAAGAREAAARARALAPTLAAGYAAQGDYDYAVTKQLGRAAESYAAGLRLSPEDADLLSGAAVAEQYLGQWDSSLVHLERAATLDPRSVQALGRLGRTLLWLRRYPEARAPLDRALALAPADLGNREIRLMVNLGEGDLAGARTILRDTPASVDPGALEAFMGNFWDLYWVLDDAQQQQLLRLSPAAFGDDRTGWGIVLAETWWLRGDTVRARSYADTAQLAFAAQLKDVPGDAQLHVFRGLALAYLGRKAEAIQEGERGTSLDPMSRDASNGPYIQHILVRIYLLTGETDKALTALEPLLKAPYYLSPGWLRIDPTFAPLRGNARFERMVGGGG